MKLSDWPLKMAWQVPDEVRSGRDGLNLRRSDGECSGDKRRLEGEAEDAGGAGAQGL